MNASEMVETDLHDVWTGGKKFWITTDWFEFDGPFDNEDQALEALQLRQEEAP